jgi:energy-coupling factor transporter ATP-binding protein EcfA2
MQPFVKTIHPRGVLSFAPDSEPLPLTPLNVLIGPNGSGKSNLIEIFELLKALPTDLAEVIRDGGGIGEWLWKGESKGAVATISAELRIPGVEPLIGYRLEFGAGGQGLEVLDEAIEDAEEIEANAKDRDFYYRIRNGRPMLRFHKVRIGDLMKAGVSIHQGSEIILSPQGFDRRQSVLSQRKDPDLYPEVTAVATWFASILTFREWGLWPVRAAEPASARGSTERRCFARCPEPGLDSERHRAQRRVASSECCAKPLSTALQTSHHVSARRDHPNFLA